MRLFIAAILATAGITFWANRAECVWCPTWTCYNSAGCNQCVCMNTGGFGGKCVGFNYAESIDAEILP